MTVRLAATLLLLAPLAATAAEPQARPAPPAPEPMTAAECEVFARELSFAQSVADHDAAAFADHVDADTAFNAGGPRPQRGRDAVVRAWGPIVEGKDLKLSWYPTRTTIAGVPDIAVSNGPALFESLRPGAEPKYALGGFHSVWHRNADGKWRVLFDDGVEPRPATEAEVAAFRAGRQATCPQG